MFDNSEFEPAYSSSRPAASPTCQRGQCVSPSTWTTTLSPRMTRSPTHRRAATQLMYSPRQCWWSTRQPPPRRSSSSPTRTSPLRAQWAYVTNWASTCTYVNSKRDSYIAEQRAPHLATTRGAEADAIASHLAATSAVDANDIDAMCATILAEATQRDAASHASAPGIGDTMQREAYSHIDAGMSIYCSPRCALADVLLGAGRAVWPTLASAERCMRPRFATPRTMTLPRASARLDSSSRLPSPSSLRAAATAQLTATISR